MTIATSKGILLDTTRCVGCGACTQACKERNRLPKTADDPLEDRMSDRTYTVLEQRGKRFVRRMCMHCITPSCASACPVGAFKKTDAGPVVYDEDLCMGCRYCMLACPFNVPKYEWSKALPRVRKCDMCADRLAQGLKTACSTVCPTGATLFGTREELLAEAEKRMRENPGRYDKNLYGDDEVGGTAVMLMTDAPADQAGYPTSFALEPPAMMTWRVLKLIPSIVMVGATALGGIWWVRNRRDEVEAVEGHGKDHGSH